MSTPEEQQAMRAMEFATTSFQLAIERLSAQIDRLETAFLKTHPTVMLPDIPYTAKELAFFKEYEDLLD